VNATSIPMPESTLRRLKSPSISNFGMVRSTEYSSVDSTMSSIVSAPSEASRSASFPSSGSTTTIDTSPPLYGSTTAWKPSPSAYAASR
jgi:hypothetical protein